MATLASNKIKYLLATKKIDFMNDSFKIILMATGFVFNVDTHHQYTDVSASELGTGSGYTINDKILTGVTITEDDANDRTEVAWNSPSWIAVGGDIGPSPGAIIFDDSEADDSIVFYIDFTASSAEQTQVSGGTLTIATPKLRLS